MNYNLKDLHVLGHTKIYFKNTYSLIQTTKYNIFKML